MKNQKPCERCKLMIDIKKEKYVLLGTYFKSKAMGEAYFHFNCWRLHFEEKARQKAEAVIKGMQERIMPMATEVISRITGRSN